LGPDGHGFYLILDLRSRKIGGRAAPGMAAILADLSVVFPQLVSWKKLLMVGLVVGKYDLMGLVRRYPLLPQQAKGRGRHPQMQKIGKRKCRLRLLAANCGHWF
jgi:hypothetical protein